MTSPSSHQPTSPCEGLSSPSTLLWQKESVRVDPGLQQFLAGEDASLDQQLLPWDLQASLAHVRGLGRMGALSEPELHALSEALMTLATRVRHGDFSIDERFEDGHSAIEAALIDSLGELGKKVHLGRSRNDQVLVALRLFEKDALARLDLACSSLADTCLQIAEEHPLTPMPGYTHLQRAVPSSVGLWMASFAEGFLDDVDTARAARERIDACPLGTAAGYGVNAPLDREGVATELGFKRVLINPMYAQNSRGKLELLVLQALEQPLLDLRRLAWDLSLFTMSELGFVRLPPELTTGSSIMPNKHNPDVIELLRAAGAPVSAAIHEISAVLSLPSGYHRDLQRTKGPLLRAVKEGLQALSVAEQVLRLLTFDKQRMRMAITREMLATDRTVHLALQGIPFRDAYRQVADDLGTDGETLASDTQVHESLDARVSLGGTAALGLDRLRARLRR